MFNAEFAHFINVLIGVDTPFQLFCIENKINNHRKLKAKWKDIGTLEYTDSTTGRKVTLSDDDINEFVALVSFKHHLQNKLGPQTKNPVDITQYSREDFLRYYEEEYNSNNPTQYNQALAQAAQLNRAMAQATQQVAEKQEAETKKLAADTPNLMTTTLLGKLPTLQIQNLYGLRKDRIDCSSNRLDIGTNT
jgi:hypothetical protein